MPQPSIENKIVSTARSLSFGGIVTTTTAMNNGYAETYMLVGDALDRSMLTMINNNQ